MNTNYTQCMYVNAEVVNAKGMLQPCSQKEPNMTWACVSNTMIDKEHVSWAMERPHGDNISGNLPHTLSENVKSVETKPTSDVVEGFTNLGESYVTPGECPDGYYPIDGKCIQLCQNCKFNAKKFSKSKEFNQYDPCFPHQGVYAGLSNDGNSYCTCGNNNQYCPDIFDTQGGMLYDNIYTMNVGDYGMAGDMSAY